MSLGPHDVLTLAQALMTAELNRQPISPLSETFADLDEVDAYHISKARLQIRNRIKTGYKLGYTSEAMRRQMNINSPNYGVLTDDLFIDGTEIPYASLIHPLVEPEIAIRLRQGLPARASYDRQSILEAHPEFMPALEVCDTRYLSYQFKATDNIADNSSAARYVLGPAFPVSAETRLEDLAVELWIDDEKVDAGIGANALGDPLLAVAWLANRLLDEGQHLEAGDVVLTGGLTKGYLMKQGQEVSNQIAGGATVTLRFT
ncbi:MAG: fumarylacetoacetate hydrolase family protein [Pusillimonas sp.]